MLFTGPLPLDLRPTRLRWLYWVVALIALDALLGSWLYGDYLQALGRNLVYIENAAFHQFEIQPRIDLSERQSRVLIRQQLARLPAPAE